MASRRSRESMSLGHAHAINKGKQGNFAVDDLGLFTLSVFGKLNPSSVFLRAGVCKIRKPLYDSPQ